MALLLQSHMPPLEIWGPAIMAGFRPCRAACVHGKRAEVFAAGMVSVELSQGGVQASVAPRLASLS